MKDENEERERVVAWRLHELLEAGYDAEAAERIAHRFQGPRYIDLHRACDLLERGCDQETALKILC